MLSVALGVGMGIVQNKFFTDFDFRIGRYGTHKGIIKRHQYISYNLLYDFNSDNSTHINQFINLGFRFNLSNNLHDYRWMGFEVGYLIGSSGELFESPTFKLGTMLDLTNTIKVYPEIYFDDGFSKIYPGVRIGIQFINNPHFIMRA